MTSTAAAATHWAVALPVDWRSCPARLSSPGYPAMRRRQSLDGALLAEVAVVALAQQADPVDHRAVQPGLAVGVADDPQRAGQRRRAAPGVDAAQRGDCGDPAAAPGDPQPQRADDPVDVSFGVPACLDGDLELGERADRQGVVEGQELLGFLGLAQAFIGPALDLLVLPRGQPLLQCGDPVLPVDQVVPVTAVVHGGRIHLLRVERRGQLANPGLVEVALGQRVDPHLGERHPPQPGLSLDPALHLGHAGHRIASFT